MSDLSNVFPESQRQLPDCEQCGGSGQLRSPDPGDDEFELIEVCPDCMGEGKLPAGPRVDHLPDEPPAASEFGLGLPGAQPRDWTPQEARVADYLAAKDGSLTAQSDRAKVWEGMVSPYYAGVGCDELGIFLHPAAWNCERLPGREEALLAYFFKLVYMERLRQLRKWGDQRHPDGTGSEFYEEEADGFRRICQRAASQGKVTWVDILLEEVYETAACPQVVRPEDWLVRDGEPDLESEMVQSAAVLAAWHSDVCRRVWETEQGEMKTDRENEESDG